MPRRDRRFTGDDLRRLYCKNLSPLQRRFFDITSCDWADLNAVEQTQEVFQFLEDSGLIHELLDRVPYGYYIEKAIRMSQYLLGGGDISEIAWIPTMDYTEVEELSGRIMDAIHTAEEENRPKVVRFLQLILGP